MIDKIHYKNQIAYTLPNVNVRENKVQGNTIGNAAFYQPEMQSWDSTIYDEPLLENSVNEWNEIHKIVNVDEEECIEIYKKGYVVEEQLSHEMEYTINREYTYTQSTLTKEKIERVKKHEEGMYLYAMTTQEDLTLNSLYKASFTGNNKQSNRVYSNEEVTSVLAMNNLDDTGSNRKAVQSLLGLGIDINEEQVIKYQNIQEVIGSLEYNKQIEEQSNWGNLPKDEWIENPQKAYEERVFMKEDKILYIEKDISQIVDELTQVDDQMIGELTESGKEITIGNLRESLLKNTQKILKTSPVPIQDQKISESIQGNLPINEEVNEGNIRGKISKVKGQINEIRARLNVESAQKLSEKMPLESTELSKVAEGLRQVEEETIDTILQQAHMEITPQSRSQLTQVLQATQAIAKYPVQALRVQVETNETVTIEQLHQAIQIYEDTGTVAEKRFGETIDKVDAQIVRFLEEHNLPQTQNTIQCTKALIASQMDVTSENLEGIQPIIEKMNIVLDELTPPRAAAFIKEGLNPYKASINHLVTWIGQERIPQIKESVASAIVALEDKGKINEEQKQSLVGLYRILHGTQTNRDQVIGYLFKNDLPLTVEHLEEAVRYADKKQLIMKNIDDSVGELESIKVNQPTARQMIEEVQGEIGKVIDLSKVLESEEIQVNPDNINKLTRLNTILYPFIKQTFKREIGDFQGIDILPQSLQDKISRVKDIKPEILEFMIKQEISITLSNIYTIDEIMKDPSKYKDLLKEKGLVDKNYPESFEKLEENLKEIQEKVANAKQQSAYEGDFLGYKDYKQLEEMAEVNKQLNQKTGVYHIPFMIDGEIKHVDLYINQHKKKNRQIAEEGINVVMRYETKGLGQVMAYMNIRGDSVTYKVTGETPQATKTLEKEKGRLESILSHIGYNIAYSEYKSSKAIPMVEAVQRTETLKDGTFEVKV